MVASGKWDKIHLRDLRARCIVGINDWERETPQDISLTLTLHTDLSVAGKSDRLEDTVDYKKLKDRVLKHVEDSQFFLVERLAESVAQLCLEDPKVKQVDLIVDKLGALRYVRSVAVEMTRQRQET